jgi:hypothetical protein
MPNFTNILLTLAPPLFEMEGALREKIDLLLASFRQTSNNERLSQKLLHLSEWLDNSLAQEENARQQLLEEIASLEGQLEQFIDHLSPQPPDLSIVAKKQRLLEQFQSVRAQAEELLRQIDALSLEMHSPKQRAQFLDSMPNGQLCKRTSLKISYLTQQLEQLKEEQRNYAALREQAHDEVLALMAESKVLGVELLIRDEFSDLSNCNLYDLQQERTRLTSLLYEARIRRALLIEQAREGYLILKECSNLVELIDLNFIASIEELSLSALEELASQVSSLRLLHFQKEWESELELLEKIWILIPDQRERFILPSDPYTPQAIETLKGEVARLTPLPLLAQRIQEALDRREKFIEEMKEFESKASDPARLFRSSFQLNQEEKFRKTAYPTLLKVESELTDSLANYQTATGGSKWQGGKIEELLERQINERYVSKTFFKFFQGKENHRPNSKVVNC